MALEKTINANGSHGKHRFTLNVKESSTNYSSSFIDYIFTISPIQTGWRWSGWGSNISYEIEFKYRQQGDEEDTILKFTGTIPSYNGSSTINLKTGSNIEIPHDSDGTRTLQISFKVTDNANGKNSSGQYYTPGNASASDTFTLTTLHTPPTINYVVPTELNNSITSLGVQDYDIVQFLSRKKFTLGLTFYDNTTLSSFKVYYNGTQIGTSSTNEIVIDFNNIGELTPNQNNQIYLDFEVTDNLNGTTTKRINYPVTLYSKPSIEKTSTNIKRKTGNGVVLTDNKVNLNFVGSTYKENNNIGNNNTPIVEYKIWNTTEPSSYTQLQATVSGNNVSVSDYEISNIDYSKVYNYKIRLRDSFGNSNEKEGTVPTGQSVWTEYKDRVDFINATIQGKDVLTTDDQITSGSNANGEWIKYPNGTMMCYFDSGTTGTTVAANDITNLSITFPEEFISAPFVMTQMNSGSSSATIGYIQHSAWNVSITGFTFKIFSKDSSERSPSYGYLAIGKWK